MAMRHKEFAGMCRKILQMKEKAKVDVEADAAEAKLCKHCGQEKETHQQGHWNHDPLHGHLYRCKEPGYEPKDTSYEAKGSG